MNKQYCKFHSISDTTDYDECEDCVALNKRHEKISDKYRITLLNDAEKIEITWRFDEQQADPIHRNNFIEELKKELEQSLETG